EARISRPPTTDLIALGSAKPRLPLRLFAYRTENSGEPNQRVCDGWTLTLPNVLEPIPVLCELPNIEFCGLLIAVVASFRWDVPVEIVGYCDLPLPRGFKVGEQNLGSRAEVIYFDAHFHCPPCSIR